MKRILLLAAIAFVVLGAGAAVLFWPKAPASSKGPLVPIATAKPADFAITIRVPGGLEPAETHPVVCDTTATTIVSLMPDGSQVKAGDVIIKLETTAIEKEVTDHATGVTDAEEQVRTAEENSGKAVTNARAGLTKAEESQELTRTQNQAAQEKAQAELAFRRQELTVAQGQLEKRTRLAEEKLLSRSDLEASEDDVRNAEAAVRKAERAVQDAAGDVAVTERLAQLGIDQARLALATAEADLKQSVTVATRRLDTARVDLTDAQARMKATSVTAPVDGVLMLERTWRGEVTKVGDKVNEGQRLARIVNPADIWVRCDINEADIERVKAGQSATIWIPALGNIRLRGRVKVIDNLARERQWWEGGVPGKKVFGALIELRDRNARLRPGAGASVEIELEKVNTGVAVPVDAIFERGGKFVVYRAEKGGAPAARFRAVAVTVGKRNDLLAVVKGALRAGDRVALRRPAPETLVAAAQEAKR